MMRKATRPRLFISFSGGETSAFMAQWLLKNRSGEYDEIAVVFANTGQENEETLEFVAKCDDAFGLNLKWVEAETHPGERRAPTARIVDFKTASRDGRPFEDVVSKYGIPNASSPHCTRDLKLNPMRDYMRTHLGWESSTYETAIGIRADEIDRISSQAKERGLIYPLITDVKMTKPSINDYWEDQPFRLKIRGYQGNCKWCWKKSFRKHYTILSENPGFYDFPERLEREYGNVGPEFEKGERAGYSRVFFRGNTSTIDLRKKHAELGLGFTPAHDDAVNVTFQPEFDFGGGCSESCEVHSDDDFIQGESAQ